MLNLKHVSFLFDVSVLSKGYNTLFHSFIQSKPKRTTRNIMFISKENYRDDDDDDTHKIPLYRNMRVIWHEIRIAGVAVYASVLINSTQKKNVFTANVS